MDLPAYKNKNLSIDERVEDLLSRMSLEEMLRQMSIHFLNGNVRLQIPHMKSGETLHGVVMPGATVFPQALSLGATWDVELIHKVASAIALEARAMGVHIAFAPMLGLGRDPRWGRIEESYGEDPYLVSEMGCAYIRGLQGEGESYLDDKHIIAVAKHVVADGEPIRGINGAPVDISMNSLRELHLKPFEDAVKKAKVGGLMPAHHSINRVPCHANKWLLTDLIRNEWGFEGLFVSDCLDIPKLYGFGGVGYTENTQQHRIAKSNAEAGMIALRAGVDDELGGDWSTRPYGKILLEAIEKGEFPDGAELIKRSARRVLKAKMLLGLFDDGKPVLPSDDPEGKTTSTGIVNGEEEAAIAIQQGFFMGCEKEEKVDALKLLPLEEHNRLALEAAEKSIILLKNENGLLPLDRSKLKRIAVIGQNATDVVLGGYTTKEPRYYINVLEGIKRACGSETDVVYEQGYSMSVHDNRMGTAWENSKDSFLQGVSEAVEAARNSDVAVIVAGGNRSLCGENTDSDDIDLPWAQQELIKRVYATGTPVVLILINGRPNSIVWESENIPAILQTFYLGQETGTALANVLFGAVNPCGKLPVAIPRRTGQIPVLYNALWWSSPKRYSGTATSAQPLYPFGYGLSYTSFEFSDLYISSETMRKDDTIYAGVKVTNTGSREGEEVVQMYIMDEFASIVRPMRELKGFKKVRLLPGESINVSFPITFEELKFWKDDRWVVEEGTFRVYIGNSCTCMDSVTFELK